MSIQSNESNYLLTFEFDPQNEILEIHGDKNGLEKLRVMINKLISKDDFDHIHLMTDEWGGAELSSEKQNEQNNLINHVKIFRWS